MRNVTQSPLVSQLIAGIVLTDEEREQLTPVQETIDSLTQAENVIPSEGFFSFRALAMATATIAREIRERRA